MRLIKSIGLKKISLSTRWNRYNGNSKNKLKKSSSRCSTRVSKKIIVSVNLEYVATQSEELLLHHEGENQEISSTSNDPLLLVKGLVGSSRGYYVLHLSFSQLYRVYLAKTPVGTTQWLFRRCCIDTDRFADENYGNPAGSSTRCRIPITAERPTDKKSRNSLSYHRSNAADWRRMKIERCESSVRKSPRCTESHVTLSTSRDLQKRRREKKRVGRKKRKKRTKEEREKGGAGQSREENRSADSLSLASKRFLLPSRGGRSSR